MGYLWQSQVENEHYSYANVRFLPVTATLVFDGYLYSREYGMSRILVQVSLLHAAVKTFNAPLGTPCTKTLFHPNEYIFHPLN